MSKAVDKEGDSKFSYTCAVCDVQASSAQLLNEHLRGRQHQINLDNRKAASRSVYVRGFPRKTSPDELKEFFNHYGVVKNVWMPGSDVYAIVEFADEAVAEGVLHSGEPLRLKNKRLTVKPRYIRVHHKRHRHVGESLQEDKKTHPQQQKSKGHHSRGPRPPEEILNFDPSVMAAISAAKSVDEQLTIISTHYKMPMSAIKSQLTVCKALFDELHIHFPECMVIPFGATISGHGTLTSDCDICLLTEPTPKQQAFFSPSNYHPTELNQPTVEVQSSLLTPSSPLREDSMTSGSEASSASASPTQLPHTHTTKRTHYDLVACSVRKMPQVSKFYAIPHARCPIVRFTFDPLAIHCDLSINNVLGPANTRLMQAYCRFDNRFALLVPFIRLWVKCNGPSRTQLNNYTVSLMLIYCLQRCHPPVLPCLQSPGPWPKSMSWYSKLGFASTPQPSITVGPWSCDFVPPESLLPSTNTQSPVDLLLHFFKFYSDWTGEQVVAIHCPTDKTLSLSEAKELAVPPQKLGYKTRPFKNQSQLVVQDPFEFDHNVCKSLSKLSCEILFHRIKMAGILLSTKKSILALFDQGEYNLLEAKLFAVTKTLVFSCEEVKSLLQVQNDPVLAALADHVSHLNLNNTSIRRSLSMVVLKAITNYLRDKLNFTCLPSELSKEQPMQEEDNTSVHLLSQSMSTDDLTKVVIDTNLDPSVSESANNVAMEPLTGEMNQSSSSGVLAASGCSSKAAEELTKTVRAGDSCGRKRALSSDDEVKGDLETEETKRTRKSVEPLTALDVLHQAQEECVSEGFLCSVMRDTWTHRRERQRKQQRQGEETMETTELTDSLPTPLPLLQVKVSIGNSKVSPKSVVSPESVVIMVDQLAPLNMNKFKNWFALINKELRATT